jgi:hypothetical protein
LLRADELDGSHPDGADSIDISLNVVEKHRGMPQVAVQGAYFNRPYGTSPVGLFSQSAAGLLDPADGNLWIGAGVAALVVAAVLTLLARRSHL